MSKSEVPQEERELTASELIIKTQPIPDLEIQEFIGRGSYGLVFKAKHKRLDIDLAVKFMTYQIGDPLLEAVKQAKIRNFGLLKIYDAGICEVEKEGQKIPVPYMISEYLDPEEYTFLNVKKYNLFHGDQITYFLQDFTSIALLIEKLADEKIFNGDIKPKNIATYNHPNHSASIMPYENRVKLIDFGSNHPGIFTYQYAAPEIIYGYSGVNLATETYSFCIMLAEKLLQYHAVRIDFGPINHGKRDRKLKQLIQANSDSCQFFDEKTKKKLIRVIMQGLRSNSSRRVNNPVRIMENIFKIIG